VGPNIGGFSSDFAGASCQDLSLLNRDIKKVILFEDHAEAATLQPENTLDVPEFTGDPQDIYLVKIIPFLESTRRTGGTQRPQCPRPLDAASRTVPGGALRPHVALALSGVEDVRPVLQAYRGKDIPAVFAEKQRKLAELKAQQQQQGGAKPRGLVSLLRSTPVRRRDGRGTSAPADPANSDRSLRLRLMWGGLQGVAPPAGAPPAAA